MVKDNKHFFRKILIYMSRSSEGKMTHSYVLGLQIKSNLFCIKYSVNDRGKDMLVGQKREK
jgi:hypothetical protein